MKKTITIKPGYHVLNIKTGHRGLIGDIQYVNNRYQLTNISGWQYGIENLVIIP